MLLKELLEASNWAKDLAKQNRDRAKLEKVAAAADERAARAASKRVKKPEVDTAALHREATDRLGDTFPDLDPVDALAGIMRKRGVSYQDIQAAFKKHGAKGEKSIDDHMGSMWSSMADDAMFDAKNGHASENSPFYRMENGKPVQKRNPYK